MNIDFSSKDWLDDGQYINSTSNIYVPVLKKHVEVGFHINADANAVVPHQEECYTRFLEIPEAEHEELIKKVQICYEFYLQKGRILPCANFMDGWTVNSIIIPIQFQTPNRYIFFHTYAPWTTVKYGNACFDLEILFENEKIVWAQELSDTHGTWWQVTNLKKFVDHWIKIGKLDSRFRIK